MKICVHQTNNLNDLITWQKKKKKRFKFLVTFFLKLSRSVKEINDMN